MTDAALIKKIREMNSLELLEEILNNPTYITDSYFKDICKAIYQRFEALKKLHEKEGLSMEEIEKTSPQGSQYDLWKEWEELSIKINRLGNVIQNDFSLLIKGHPSPIVIKKQIIIEKEQFQKEFAITIKELTQTHDKIVNLLKKIIKNK